jgi:colanic acid/amylovoran biosynthesis protein
MNILVINLHSSRNAGDHVLLEVTLQQLAIHFPNAAFTLAMNDPASYARYASEDVRLGRQVQVVDSFFGWFRASSPHTPLQRLGRALLVGWWLLMGVLLALWTRLSRKIQSSNNVTRAPKARNPTPPTQPSPPFPEEGWWGVCWSRLLPDRPRASLRAYFSADLVISCPGNFVYSRGYGAGLTLVVPILTTLYGWLLGKPLYMMPQTIGPLWRGWEHTLVRWMLNRMRLILLRDATSVALLQQMGFPAQRCHLLPDVAFVFAGRRQDEGRAALTSQGIPEQPRPALGVTLINWGAQNPRFRGQATYEAAVAAALQTFLQEESGMVVLFAQVCGPTPADDDRIPARRVQQQLAAAGYGQRTFAVDEVEAPLLKAMYGCMDLFLGSRLHSNIFALGENVPVVAIAYQDKTWGVMEMLGMRERVIDIEQVEAPWLTAQLQLLWRKRGEVRRQLQAKMAAIRDQAAQACALIAADVQGGSQ